MKKVGRKRKQHKIVDGVEYKHCSHCKQWKAVSMFYASKYSWDLLHNLCKRCSKHKSRLSYKKYAKKINKNRRNKTNFDLSKVKPHKVINNVRYKRCYKCKKEKTLNNFHKCSRNWDSLANICKMCNKQICKEHYQRLKIKNTFREKRRKKQQEKMANDPLFRLERNLRNRLYQAVKGNVKHGTTYKLIGCNRSHLIEHIEKQFAPGMTWENYGSTWHIDHIIPCAAFDLSQKSEQEQCFHYTNLQPLWSKENLAKGSKLFYF